MKDPKDEWDNCWGPRTVVINPNDCRWAGCEKHGKFDGETLSPLAEASASEGLAMRTQAGPRS